MIRIPQGNEIKVLFPVYKDKQRLDAGALDSVAVTIGIAGDQQAVPHTIEQGCVSVRISPDLPIGVYDVHITANDNTDDDGDTYAVASHLHNAVRIVRWNEESDFVPDNPIFGAATYLGSNSAGALIEINKDQTATIYSQQRTIERLTSGGITVDTSELEDKINSVAAKVDAVKLTSETTLDLVEGIESDVIYQCAQEVTLNRAKQDILAAVGNVQIDTSGLAKQGSDQSATNTAILAAVSGIDVSGNAQQGNNSNATNTAILAAIGDVQTALSTINTALGAI